MGRIPRAWNAAEEFYAIDKSDEMEQDTTGREHAVRCNTVYT